MSFTIRHAQQIFMIETWLWDLLDTSSPIDPDFVADFIAMLEARSPKEATPICLRLIRKVTKSQVALSGRNFVRFWFHCGNVLISGNHNVAAFEAFNICALNLDSKDIPAQVQLLSKFAYAKRTNLFLRYAIYDYQQMNDLLLQYPGIAFVEGSADAMIANVHLQQSCCYLDLGYLYPAYVEMLAAAQCLNGWIQQTVMKGISMGLLPANVGTGKKSLLLPLTVIPQKLLHATDSETTSWLAVYNTTYWHWGMFLLWQCKIDPTNAAKQQELLQFVEWLYQTLPQYLAEIRKVGSFQNLSRGWQQLCRQSASMGLLGAEALFVLIETGGIDLSSSLRLAREFLVIAQDANDKMEPGVRSAYFPHNLRLMALHFKRWRIEESKQFSGKKAELTLPFEIEDDEYHAEDDISDLIEELRYSQPPEYTDEKNDLRHVRQRFAVLLGQLYWELGDMEKAREVWENAAAFFASEGIDGHRLRHQEVLRLLGSDDFFIDEEDDEDIP